MSMPEITVDMGHSAICCFSGSISGFVIFSQNIICESSLRLRLRGSFSRCLFSPAGCPRHNQPGLQFITQFPTWGFLNHPYSLSLGYKSMWCHSGAWPLGWEYFPSIQNQGPRQPMFFAIPWGFFPPHPYSGAMALWVLISCRLG